MPEADGSYSPCRPPKWRPIPQRGGGHHELYLMCDDIRATVAELKAKGVEFTDEGFGLMTSLRLPGGGDLGRYEPRHPTPLAPSG